MARATEWPEIRKVTVDDLVEVLAAGLRDFLAAPQYGLLVGAIYAAVGWLLVALLWYLDALYFAYPIAMGFALVAPFASVAFYSVSDLLERGQPLSWPAVLGAIRAASKRDLRWMALVTGFALVIWMDIAAFLLFALVGVDGFHADFLERLFTTTKGLLFFAAGNIIGAIIALLVFSISVVSFPMLYDRDVDFVTAMVTSVRLVIANPVTMLVWCAVIGILTGLSLAAAFLGLLVMLPIVGHASWHLYRRAVAPAAAGATPPDAEAKAI